MFSFLVNGVTAFKHRKSQRKTASIGTASSSTPTTIKIYKEDINRVHGQFTSPELNPTHTPRVGRPGHIIGNINVLTQYETPFTVEPTSVDMQKGKGPMLSKLPGEILNIIYSDLLSSGHPQFLRASKALHIEGTALVAEKGVYRMSYGHNKINNSLSSQRIVDSIRNIDIAADLSHSGGSGWLVPGIPQIWLLQAFGEPGLVRGQCNVSFKVHSHNPALWVADISSALRLLLDFETVVVRADINWPEPDSVANHPFGSMRGRASTTWFKQCKDVRAPWSDFKCQVFFDYLRLDWTLGMGRLEHDEDDIRLVFHPRKALEEVGRL